MSKKNLDKYVDGMIKKISCPTCQKLAKAWIGKVDELIVEKANGITHRIKDVYLLNADHLAVDVETLHDKRFIRGIDLCHVKRVTKRAVPEPSPTEIVMKAFGFTPETLQAYLEKTE